MAHNSLLPGAFQLKEFPLGWGPWQQAEGFKARFLIGT
jgi:hypothetical protein